MTTTADVLAQCRNDFLMTGARDARNLLSGAVDDSVISFAFTYALGAIDVGARVSIDLEDVYVYDKGSNSATVSRGDFGTTAAAHDDGTVVLVNPRFSDAQILRAVNDELSSLSAPGNGLFRVDFVDLTANASVQGYDLTGVTDVLSIIDVRYQAIGSDMDWPLVSRDLWEHARSEPTSAFASGQSMFIRGDVDPGRTVRVKYRAPFAPLVTVADNVVTVAGLHAEAHDILALGAAIRLTAGLEVRRNQTESQGDTRRAAEVPAGANLGSNRGLMQQRAMRIAEERSRLQSMYPPRLS